MTIAYVDTSCLVAIALDEPGSGDLSKQLAQFDRLTSSNLLEAEFRAALNREKVEGGDELLTWVTWVFPDRSLSAEMGRVLRSGYLKGSDLWHLAHALYIAETPSEMPFLTLDTRQRDVAGELGFPVG